MICSVEETGREDEVELVIDKEVVLKPKYRGMSARDLIKHRREKNTSENVNMKSNKAGEDH